MSKQTLVTAKREQDGKFALLLESEVAVQRDLRREALRRQRMQELNAAPENAWLMESGITPSDMFA